MWCHYEIIPLIKRKEFSHIMTYEEFVELCKELRAQGATDKDILDALFQMFLDGKISKVDLGKLAGALGYQLSQEFLNDKTPDPISLLNAEDETTVDDDFDFDDEDEDEDEEAVFFTNIFEELRAQGATDENLLDAIYEMYLDGMVLKDDLIKLAGMLGYQAEQEFIEDTDIPTPNDLINGKSEDEIVDIVKQYIPMMESQCNNDDEDSDFHYFSDEEFAKFCKERRAQGATEENIFDELIDMYLDGKISKENAVKLATDFVKGPSREEREYGVRQYILEMEKENL